MDTCFLDVINSESVVARKTVLSSQKEVCHPAQISERGLPFLRLLTPVLSEGDQPWDFFGRDDAKAETPVLWPPHAKS